MTFTQFLDFIIKNAFHWWDMNSILFPLLAFVFAIVLIRLVWWFIYYCTGGKSNR